MKTFALLAATAMAASTVTADPCVLVELAPIFLDILDPVYACSDATGYSIVPPNAKPTPAQGAAICAKCSSLLVAASKKTFPSCTLKLDGVETRLDEYFNGIISACGDLPRSAGSGSSTNTSTVVGGAATVTPPKTESIANSSSSAPSSVATPTPSSSSSAVSMSAAAVLLASAIATLAL